MSTKLVKRGRNSNVSSFQDQLRVAGFNPGKSDGIWGEKTDAAWRRAQAAGYVNQNGRLVKKNVNPKEFQIPTQPQQAGLITSGSNNKSSNYTPWTPTLRGGQRYQENGINVEDCARYANEALRQYKDKKGRILYTNQEVGGDAWTRLSAGKHAKMTYSGYDGMDYDPAKYSEALSNQRNWAAADNLYKNFDSKTLDKNKTYMVNMYFNSSPNKRKAWEGATNGTTGTHTGNLYWNPETNSWRISHNIHGVVHDDDFIQAQGSKNRFGYGVTAIAEAPMVDYTRRDWDKAHPVKAAINKIHDFGMWKQGGRLIPKAQGGNVLPEVTVTGIDVNKHAKTPQHRQFIQTLNNDRNYFMRKYHLSDQQYADLSKFALNLTSAESDGGRDRNVFKRTYIYPDWLIHAGKLIKRGKDSANSRGLTQIKYDDDIDNPDLQKYYKDLGITGRNIKYDPSAMARATLGRTLWIQDELQKQTGGQPIHYADGTEMPQETAQYLYWNRGKVTDGANGNPETGSTVGAAKQIAYFNKRKYI